MLVTSKPKADDEPTKPEPTKPSELSGGEPPPEPEPDPIEPENYSRISYQRQCRDEDGA